MMGRQVIFVPELLSGFRETERLIDLVPLTFVTDQGSGIDLILQQTPYHGAIPQILFLDFVLQPFRHPFPQQHHLHLGRRFALFLIEHSCDGFQPHTAYIRCKNQVDRLRGFGNDFYLIRIFVLEVAERRGDDNARFLLLPVTRRHTAAAISGVEVVHEALKTDDQIIRFIEGIDIFCGRKYPDIVLAQVVNE